MKLPVRKPQTIARSGEGGLHIRRFDWPHAVLPGVSPDQLYGIETSPYAHELAQVAIWIGYLQWTVENGFGTRQELILSPMANIVEMDAILACDDDGNLYEPEWPEADVIVGTPPFLGGKRMRAELRDEYVEDLFKMYAG